MYGSSRSRICYTVIFISLRISPRGILNTLYKSTSSFEDVSELSEAVEADASGIGDDSATRANSDGTDDSRDRADPTSRWQKGVSRGKDKPMA